MQMSKKKIIAEGGKALSKRSKLIDLLIFSLSVLTSIAVLSYAFITLTLADSDTGLFENSSVAIRNLCLPPGNFTVSTVWGNTSRVIRVTSDGNARDFRVEFSFANIRKPLKLSIEDENGSELVKLHLVPSVTGYKLVSINLNENVEIQSIEVSEVVSSVVTRMKFRGLLSPIPIEDLKLKVEGEDLTPIVQSNGDLLVVTVPPLVVDPGACLNIDLRLGGNPPLKFTGNVALVGDRLVAGGSCDGPVLEATIATDHTIGLTKFSISMPVLEPSTSKLLSRQTTEVIIRKGVPSSVELYVIVKDEKGKPLADAEVESVGAMQMKGVTDASGVARFTMENVTDAFTVIIKVSKKGFKQAEKSVNILSTLTTVELTLEKEKTAMDLAIDLAISYVRGLQPYFLPLLVGGLVLLVLGALKLKKASVVLGLMLIAMAVISVLV